MQYKPFKISCKLITCIVFERHSIENDDPFMLAIVISEYVNGVGLDWNWGFKSTFWICPLWVNIYPSVVMTNTTTLKVDPNVSVRILK